MPSLFDQIQKIWGPYDVDLFADRTNHLLPCYVSWKPDPGALAVDDLSIPWSTFSHPYFNPPWSLIQTCLNKIMQERLPLATIVAPCWPIAIWFPWIRRLARAPPILLDPRRHTRLTSPFAQSPWSNPRWKMSVWLVSGGVYKTKATHPKPYLH